MVTRWAPNLSCLGYMGRDPNGRYIEYTDHEATLQAERQAAQENYEFLLQERDFVLHAFNRLSVAYGEQKHKIRDLEAQVKTKGEEITKEKKQRRLLDCPYKQPRGK